MPSFLAWTALRNKLGNLNHKVKNVRMAIPNVFYCRCIVKLSFSTRDIEVHPRSLPTLCVGDATGDETNGFVKANSVRVGGHLYTHTALCNVFNKGTCDALAHPVRISEQILEFEEVVDRPCRRKADDPTINNSDTCERQHLVVPHEPLGMSDDEIPVALDCQRCTAKDIAQRIDVVDDCASNDEVR